MSDLFGYTHPTPEFKDIRNQRPTVAEQKAILCKQLGELLRVAPPIYLQRGCKNSTGMATTSCKRKENVFKPAGKRERIANRNKPNEQL